MSLSVSGFRGGDEGPAPRLAGLRECAAPPRRPRVLHLHYFPGNASMAPHMLLEELGLPYTLHFVDRAIGAHKSPSYLALNPNGLIPVLVDDGLASGAADAVADRAVERLVLFETAAICLHLADADPSAGLAPPLGTPERAHYYKWIAWLSNTLQAWLIVYFYPERWADDDAAVVQVKAHAQTKVGSMLDILDAQLAASAGPWLLGERFSTADPYAFMLCRWTRGFGRPARSLAHLGPYLERMLARPAVQRTLAQEGFVAPWV
jgi:glutathione S-transferase